MTADPHLVTLDSGACLFKEGDPGDRAFIIESGAVEVWRGAGTAGAARIAQLVAGEVIGEMALIDRLPRTATVVAREQTCLRVITCDHYDQHYRQADPLIRLMLRGLLQRHRSSVAARDETSDVSETMQLDRDQVMQRLRMEQDLRQALARDELVLHFQPIVAVRDGTTAGYEALIRWRSPERGMVPPGVFIPIAEQSELIVDIGRWALRAAGGALARCSRAASARSAPLFLTINVSGRQIDSVTLVDDVAAGLAASAGHGRLKLEITESLLMKDVTAGTAMVQRLKSLGAQLAIDDFGTGYSSLNYLHRLQPDCLKVDRSFVKDLESDAGSSRVLQAIKGIATGFDLETVVEGVETPEQAARVHDLGFDYIQGYLYSRPLPEADAIAVTSRKWTAS